jgi:hypothetical protein
MNRDDQAFHERQFLLSVLRCYERDALSTHAFPHGARLVKTQELARIVDEQVEVGEEVFPENSTNVGIGCPNLSQVLDDDKGSFDCMGGGFQCVQNSYRRLRVAGDGNETSLPLRF